MMPHVDLPRLRLALRPQLLLLGMLSFAGVQAASRPTADVALIDRCQYPDNAAAQALWVPMAGSAPVSVANPDGQRALRMPCTFAGTQTERASWDRAITLDLIPCRGIQFQLLCSNAAPVSYFSLYFQSGEGWYHTSFFPESTAGWNTIAIDKTAATIEGKPAGWGRITAIRISAWRGADANTEFFLRDLRMTEVLGADAAVAVLRATAAAQASPDEAHSIDQYTDAIARELRAADVGCAVVSDLDITAARLQPARLVILPYNPQLPDRAADELTRYVQGGGRLLLFYLVPDRLRPLLHIEGGAHLKAPRPGSFSAIRLADGAVPGAPGVVRQQSWNINAFEPEAGAGRILADWLDDQGQPTGHPALLGSTNGIVMTHVLLPDDGTNKRRLLLALAGSLAPELWQKAVDASLGRIGKLGGFETLEEATEFLLRTAGKDARVTEALGAARNLRAAARRLASERQFAAAIDQAAAASRRLLDAYCLAQRPLPGEFRAFWCHSAFGVDGIPWDEAIQRLATNGFTAVLPNMLWGGAAYYESKVLPVASLVAQRGDQIAQCVAAGRKHGVQVHVWKVNWNLGHAVPRAFVDRLRREGRLQAGSQGAEELWLCPSHPDNRKLEVDSMVEVARNYDIDGLHFDYIRYPDGDHCFCAGCRDRFQRAAGVTIQSWPKDALPGGPLRASWLDWRRGNITAVVKAVREQTRSLKPKLKLSAAVFPNWPADRDTIGQDWKLWCDSGYLDFVCPMDYTPSNRRFEAMVAQQVGWAGKTPCYPGIGVSASSSRFGADRTIEQIGITRQQGTRGFIIFNYGVVESQELLPLLGLGVTASFPPAAAARPAHRRQQ